MIKVRQYGFDEVKKLVGAWVLKLAEAIGDDMNANRLSMLTSDIMETYYYDSLEDVRECLKKGRRGEYGYGHHKRGFVSMPLIREWMKEHLCKKAEIREQSLKQVKPERTKPFDPEKFYSEGKKYLEGQKKRERQKSNFSDARYDEIKHRYFEEKQKEKKDDEV